MQQWLFGLALELLATSLGTVGKQLVSYSARLPPGPTSKRLKVAGLAVTTLLGPLVDAAAYAFAPQSVIAPLNGLDVVWNTMTAPITLGETLEWGHVAGAVLVATGAGLSALLGPHDQSNLTSEKLSTIFLSWQFGLYVAVFTAGLMFSSQVLRTKPRGCGHKARAVALGATAGAIAGNMFCTTCVLRLIKAAIEGETTLWQETLWPYVLLIGAIAVALSNIPFMSRGLQEFEALFMVTLFEGCHIAVACISGQFVLGEIYESDPWKEAAYWTALLMIFAGLYAIQQTSVGAIVRNGGSLVDDLMRPTAENECSSGVASASAVAPTADGQSPSVTLMSSCEGSLQPSQRAALALSVPVGPPMWAAAYFGSRQRFRPGPVAEARRATVGVNSKSMTYMSWESATDTPVSDGEPSSSGTRAQPLQRSASLPDLANLRESLVQEEDPMPILAPLPAPLPALETPSSRPNCEDDDSPAMDADVSLGG